LMGVEFNANHKAGNIHGGHKYITKAIELISERAELVTDDKSTGQDVRAELKLRLDEWLKEASNKSGGRILGYMPKNDGKTVGLLHKAGSGEWQLWTCLNALRDVEPSVNLVLERISD